MNKDIESDDYHYENTNSSLQGCFHLLNSACELQIQGDITRANQTGGMSGMGGDSGGGHSVVEVIVLATRWDWSFVKEEKQSDNYR